MGFLWRVSDVMRTKQKIWPLVSPLSMIATIMIKKGKWQIHSLDRHYQESYAPGAALGHWMHTGKQSRHDSCSHGTCNLVGVNSPYKTNKPINIQWQIVVGAVKRMNWCLKVHGKKMWAEPCGLAREERGFRAQEPRLWAGDGQGSLQRTK